MMKLLVLCFVAALWLQLPSEGDAACCPSNDNHDCGDCTAPTPYCGHRGCNIFGCNCGGGCRRGRCSKRSISPDHDASDVIRAADQDGDGLMSIEEARDYLVRDVGQSKRSLSLHGDLERSLLALDGDNDNYITAREIDSDAE